MCIRLKDLTIKQAAYTLLRNVASTIKFFVRKIMETAANFIIPAQLTSFRRGSVQCIYLFKAGVYAQGVLTAFVRNQNDGYGENADQS